MNNTKYIFLLIFTILLTCNSDNLFARVGMRFSSNYSKGPLTSKNMYIPYLIYYSPTGQRAAYGKKFTLEYHTSVYFVNDFFPTNYSHDKDGNYFITEGIDYESLNVEIGASFYILKNLQVGLDTRIYTYYGGFLDNIVQGFHKLFGFPNGGRDWFAQNQVFINIPNKNNVNYHLTKQATSFGDIDL